MCYLHKASGQPVSPELIVKIVQHARQVFQWDCKTLQVIDLKQKLISVCNTFMGIDLIQFDKKKLTKIPLPKYAYNLRLHL